MVLTRSGSASPVKKGAGARSSTSKSQKDTPISATTLTPGEPLRVIIAPCTLSTAARFIALSNPLTQEPERYLFCPEIGVHQLTRTSTPKHDPHSILFTPAESNTPATRDDEAISNGYVNKSAEILTATPFDLCFTILPLLTNSAKSNLFQSVDDILEPSDMRTYDLIYVLQASPNLVEEAIARVCDVVEEGDDSLYRYSNSKALQLLITKAKRACENGLPASLEDRFVTRILEAPMLSVKREESSISVSAEPLEPTTDPGTPLESFDSQSTTASTAPSVVFSEVSALTTASTTTTSNETTIVTSAPTNTPSPEVITLQRLLTSFKYIAHTYLPPALATALLAALQDPSSSNIDFTLLTTHLSHIAKLRAEAAASIDLSSFSRKRGIEDDFEAEERAEKKKKLEEEEKRKKASQSRGVQQLSKVDVKGMKKMSAFFTKVPAKGKS